MPEKSKIFILILFILFLISSDSFAQTQNGEWWRRAPVSFKVGFIAGYFAGRDEEAHKWAPIADDMVEQIKDEERDRYKEMIRPMKRDDEYLSKISFGDFSDKVDTFYTDKENLAIPVLQAFSLVRRELSGEDKALLDCEKIYNRIAHGRGVQQEDRLRALEEKLQECASLGQKVHPDSDKEDEYLGTGADTIEKETKSEEAKPGQGQ